jgi:hypothetical protein
MAWMYLVPRKGATLNAVKTKYENKSNNNLKDIQIKYMELVEYSSIY